MKIEKKIIRLCNQKMTQQTIDEHSGKERSDNFGLKTSDKITLSRAASETMREDVTNYKFSEDTYCNDRGSIDNEQFISKYVLEYKKNFRHFLLTSRFNNTTWNENSYYRSTRSNMACIYCSPCPTTNAIPIDSVMFILEMNNDSNKILGIGMVRNHPILNKYSIYSDGNYNRYVFTGKHRIDRSHMSEEEERIMKVFDILCFKGNQHMKRGQGLKLFPVEMLYRCSKRLDLVKFICEMFKRRITI